MPDALRLILTPPGRPQGHYTAFVRITREAAVVRTLFDGNLLDTPSKGTHLPSYASACWLFSCPALSFMRACAVCLCVLMHSYRCAIAYVCFAAVNAHTSICTPLYACQ